MGVRAGLNRADAEFEKCCQKQHCSHTLKQACYRDFKDLAAGQAVRDASPAGAGPPRTGRQSVALSHRTPPPDGPFLTRR